MISKHNNQQYDGDSYDQALLNSLVCMLYTDITDHWAALARDTALSKKYYGLVTIEPRLSENR